MTFAGILSKPRIFEIVIRFLSGGVVQDTMHECSVTSRNVNSVRLVGRGGPVGPHDPQGGHCCEFRAGVLAIVCDEP